jgi:hypothetical protein
MIVRTTRLRTLATRCYDRDTEIFQYSGVRPPDCLLSGCKQSRVGEEQADAGSRDERGSALRALSGCTPFAALAAD